MKGEVGLILFGILGIGLLLLLTRRVKVIINLFIQLLHLSFYLPITDVPILTPIVTLRIGEIGTYRLTFIASTANGFGAGQAYSGRSDR